MIDGMRSAIIRFLLTAEFALVGLGCASTYDLPTNPISWQSCIPEHLNETSTEGALVCLDAFYRAELVKVGKSPTPVPSKGNCDEYRVLGHKSVSHTVESFRFSRTTERGTHWSVAYTSRRWLRTKRGEKLPGWLRLMRKCSGGWHSRRKRRGLKYIVNSLSQRKGSNRNVNARFISAKLGHI